MTPRTLLAGLLILSCLAGAGMTAAAQPAPSQTVAATRIEAAARSEVETQLAGVGVPVRLTLSGRVPDVLVPWEGETALQAQLIEPGLRPRLAVAVRLVNGQGRSRTLTVWFTAQAPAMGSVYAADAARTTVASQIQVRQAPVDLAQVRGFDPAWQPNESAGRLRRAVHAGQPVLAADFEPAPAVASGQSVRIESRVGTVRLETSGRALADANVGETVRVQPAVSAQSIQARVSAKGKVFIEE